MLKQLLVSAGVAAAMTLAGCSDDIATPARAAAATPAAPSVPHPNEWPAHRSPLGADAAIDAKVAELLRRLTIEEKVGQIVQADIASVTPQEVRDYHLGSILNGGSSGPNGNDLAPAKAWLEAADAFYTAGMESKPHPVPILWGIDAVHGHNNIIGATLFPQNVALGATRNPDLIRKIGEVTAIEIRVTGQEWTFAPTLAVVQDVRWGRSYESYSQRPDIVREYATAMIQGLQGTPGSPDFLLRGPHVIATAKHFLGDGGTFEGRDQGDNRASEAALRDVHAAGYFAALDAGVQTVMASYSSWQGQKMHGHKGLLTDVLKNRLGFDGFVVGDWNGHEQVEGCTKASCPVAINAGLDMFMAPDSWKDLYATTLAQAKNGSITAARLDDAVARILRVKYRAGLFEVGKPSSRALAGKFELLGAPEHRAVARQAVRESLVLLKNANHLLPLRAKQNVLIAGDGADNIAKQSGGWTLSWQGTGLTNANFPGATSIFAGIRKLVTAGGGNATLSVDGSYEKKPDVAIVVFGEDPYAEFQGDIETLEYEPADGRDLTLLKKLRADKIPVVAVFLSGRPRWVNPHLNAADAFVAAWLPGSEGDGIAEVLIANTDGSPRNEFKGRLSFDWPATPVPNDKAGEKPLFALGFGLTTRDSNAVESLSEVVPPRPASAIAARTYFASGKTGNGWSLIVKEGSGEPQKLATATGESRGGHLRISAVDRGTQEAGRLAAWSGGGPATLAIEGEPVNLRRETNSQLALVFDYRVDAPPAESVELAMECGSACSGKVAIDPSLRAATKGEWTAFRVPLRCFEKNKADMGKITAPFAITTAGSLQLGVANVRLDSGPGTPTVKCD
jgi:beta-glucosidase